MSTTHFVKSLEPIREMPPRAGEASKNKLLASLPAGEYERFVPYLNRVALRSGQVVLRQGAPLASVYFPTGAVCSLVIRTLDGQRAEVAVVGDEGVVGASVFFGEHHASCDVVVQLAGAADVMPADVFISEMNRRRGFYNRLIRYNQALMMHIMQSTVCNELHSAEARCARWLLGTHDRVGRDGFPFPYESVVTALSIRPSTLTLVVSSLEAAGLIVLRRGAVTIRNRAGLEAVSCECYRAIKGTATRLLPEV